jgi:hypothetical protein
MQHSAAVKAIAAIVDPAARHPRSEHNHATSRSAISRSPHEKKHLVGLSKSGRDSPEYPERETSAR